MVLTITAKMMGTQVLSSYEVMVLSEHSECRFVIAPTLQVGRLRHNIVGELPRVTQLVLWLLWITCLCPPAKLMLKP